MAPAKGTVNNPKGRPPKNRALTEILEKAGAKGNGKKIVASLLWEGATTGRVTFAEDRQLLLSVSDWAGIAKWLYQQIDGLPAQRTELTGAEGSAINFIVEIGKPDADSNDSA